MKKLMLLMCYLVVAVSAGSAQSVAPGDAAYKAYLGNGDMAVVKKMWKEALVSSKNTYTADPDNPQLLMHVALTEFGLLAATMRDQDEELFDEYVDDAEEHLEAVLKRDKRSGEARALLSAIQGFKMGYSPWKGMYLGPKSESLMDQARKDAPASALVWKLYGNSKYFTPETWGGDLKEAIRAYEKAIELYEGDAQGTNANWFYLDTLAFLGQAYSKDGQRDRAIAVYEKALRVEPAFSWVKLHLLPKAKKAVAGG